MSRPSWDQYFLKIAEEVRHRSPCLRRQVGAVFVKDKRILTTGYNGPPRGLPHCADVGCLRAELNIASGERLDICRAIHAEANGIIQAAIHGVAIDGCTLYCTNVPCFLCAKLIINAGVVRIVVSDGYPSKLGAELIQEAGVPLEQVCIDEADRSVRDGMPGVSCSCDELGA